MTEWLNNNNYSFLMVLSVMLHSSGEGKYLFSWLSEAFRSRRSTDIFRTCKTEVVASVWLKKMCWFICSLHHREWLRIISKISVFLLNLKLLNIFPCPHIAFCRRKYCILPVSTKILLQCNASKTSRGLLGALLLQRMIHTGKVLWIIHSYKQVAISRSLHLMLFPNTLQRK